MSRKTARDTLSLDEYQKAMEGIYTTTANLETIDEAPMAYKRLPLPVTVNPPVELRRHRNRVT